MGSTLRGRERIRAHERVIDEDRGCARRARASTIIGMRTREREREDRGQVGARDEDGYARFVSEKEQWSVSGDRPSAARTRKRKREGTIPKSE